MQRSWSPPIAELRRRPPGVAYEVREDLHRAGLLRTLAQETPTDLLRSHNTFANGFCIDRVQRPSKAAEKVAVRLKDALQEPVDIENAIENQIELEAWRRAFDEENAPAPAAWWKRTLEEVRREVTAGGLPVELPDWTTDIAELLAEGMKVQDIQFDPWPGTD